MLFRSEFEQKLAALMTSGVSKMPVSTPSMSLGGVDPAAFERLQQQVATLMERNAQLEEAATKGLKRRM